MTASTLDIIRSVSSSSDADREHTHVSSQMKEPVSKGKKKTKSRYAFRTVEDVVRDKAAMGQGQENSTTTK
jgi:hypothetical protein